jgi:exonuclease SbcC
MFTKKVPMMRRFRQADDNLFNDPAYLRLWFLSYRDPVDLDFTSFELACISGHNGAGKSSLLDAITWSLFGEARGKSTDIINLNQDVKAAEVVLTFEHEGNTYRVQRTLPRTRSTILEFQVKNHDGWRDERQPVYRHMNKRCVSITYLILHRSSWGKADQFTQRTQTQGV